MVFIVLPTLFYLRFLVPLFPSILLLKIVQNLVYKVPYLLSNGQAIYLLIRISHLISLRLRITPFPLTPLESASALRFYPSPTTVSTRVRLPSPRRPSNLLKTNILLFSKSFSKHHTLTAEERVSCLALFSIIVVFTATIAQQHSTFGWFPCQISGSDEQDVQSGLWEWLRRICAYCG